MFKVLKPAMIIILGLAPNAQGNQCPKPDGQWQFQCRTTSRPTQGQCYHSSNCRPYLPAGKKRCYIEVVCQQYREKSHKIRFIYPANLKEEEVPSLAYDGEMHLLYRRDQVGQTDYKKRKVRRGGHLLYASKDLGSY